MPLRLSAEHGKVSAYFNHDHGQGPIRGIYLDGNDEWLPGIFSAWFGAFSDQGPFYVSNSDIGGTDNDAFNAVGIPGFQFVQQYDYTVWTHHSNVDLFDHLDEADLNRNAAHMAFFAYQTAQR